MTLKLTLLLLGSLSVVQICRSSLPPNYQSLNAQDKQEAIWTEISSSPYPPNGLPTSNHGVFSMLGVLNPSFLTKAFTHDSDEMIAGRKKLIHTFGATAKASINIFAGSPYTGIFRTGQYPSIVRASVALMDEQKFVPGIGLKVFVDGKSSKNMFAMYGLDGQGLDFNFFSNNFYTTIPDPESFAMRALAQVFKVALWALPGGSSARPEGEGNIPLYEHASVNEQSVYAPYKLTFVPNAAVGWAPTDRTDFRVKLAQIPIGSTLWSISARRTEDSPDEVIGEMVLQSAFVASPYSDEVLYFQHPSAPWKA